MRQVPELDKKETASLHTEGCTSSVDARQPFSRTATAAGGTTAVLRFSLEGLHPISMVKRASSSEKDGASLRCWHTEFQFSAANWCSRPLIRSIPDTGPLQLPPPDEHGGFAEGSDDVKHRVQPGHYTALTHRIPQWCEPTVSWYRGPLVHASFIVSSMVVSLLPRP